jgi:hypothetical protein
MRIRRTISVATAAAVIGMAVWANVAFSACAPRGPGAAGTVPPFRQTRVIISADGIRSGTYTGPPAQFEFFNDDTGAHRIVSDPHPGHDRCPELNFGVIAAKRSVYVNFPVRGRVCGYHDETRPGDPRFQGSMVIR